VILYSTSPPSPPYDFSDHHRSLPPQELVSSVVAFTATYNLYGSLHRSQQAPLYPSQQLTTYMTASARVSKLCFNLLRSMTAFVAAYNLYGSLRKS
ncbi:hypothetical protein Tco_0101778, partial [Tanacetum coccineum]